jgi:lincosamide nucleotidyltransferase A/C/D/E
MTDADVLAVLDVLEANGVSAWLDGGWGVDALLGEQTREHADVDLAIAISDSAALYAALSRLRYEVVPGGRPANYVLRDGAGREVDVHAMAFDSEGGATYELVDGSPWRWPPGSFTGRGLIAGRQVACLSVEAQRLGHVGYEWDENDEHDMRMLRQRFEDGGAAPA